MENRENETYALVGMNKLGKFLREHARDGTIVSVIIERGDGKGTRQGQKEGMRNG